MDICKKGKSSKVFCLFISLLLYFCCSVVASEVNPAVDSGLVDDRNKNPFVKSSDFDDCSKNTCQDIDLLRKQQLQLERLEELVKNLTHLVSRLESQYSDVPEKLKTISLSRVDDEKRDDRKVKMDEGLVSKEEILPAEESRAGAGAMVVTKYNAIWSERFQFVSAVKLSSTPTCVIMLPYRDSDGSSKYSAVGDDKGKVYVFTKSGDVAIEFDSFLESEEASPVMSMVSFLLLYRNESLIVTGHENGVIVMHRVWEESNVEEVTVLRAERVRRFDTPEGGGARISILEVHHVGRKKYILATDCGGKIVVYKENGTIFGTVTPSSRPVVFLKQRLLFLTETGAGSLDLRTMKLKESKCEGLNNSFVKNYVFDAMDRSKAYGYTSEGNLIYTALMGDAMNFKCRVRSKKSMDLVEPVALQALKGYLLIVDKKKAFVYNASSQHYIRTSGLRLLFSVGLDEIVTSFAPQQAENEVNKMPMAIPSITSDYEKLVVISLGNGYVATYLSNLPVLKNEFNSILWTSPVLFFILFLFGAWHFFANKKDALIAWGPDDPFAITPGAPPASGAADRSFTDSSRSSDTMDLKGSGLRGSSRRYVSPPRYTSGAANSYRPGSDTDTRPNTSDPRFRSPSEMKYRGSHGDTAGVVPKRRDGMYVNGQLVDDSN